MKYLHFILAFLLFSVCGITYGQETAGYEVSDTQYFNKSLFGSDEVLRVRLSFDISYYKKKKPKDEYLDATLEYINNGSDTVRKDIKVRSRGKFRHEYCAFPPLLLNFKISDTTDALFAGFDKIKMVPQCNYGMSETVLREYTVYKLLNALTDFSLRVRLIQVEYVNTSEKVNTKKENVPYTEYAFLIEPTESFEKRNGVVRISLDNYGQKHIEPAIMDRIAIFNYMIGNTDWTVPMQHNIQIFTNPDPESTDYLSAVLYDFDYNGIVNSEYAVPIEDLGIDSFRFRVYQGLCRTDDEWLESLKIFSEKKDELYKIISESPYLNKVSKKYMKSFLDDFYEMLRNKRVILRSFRSKCKEV